MAGSECASLSGGIYSRDSQSLLTPTLSPLQALRLVNTSLATLAVL